MRWWVFQQATDFLSRVGIRLVSQKRLLADNFHLPTAIGNEYNAAGTEHFRHGNAEMFILGGVNAELATIDDFYEFWPCNADVQMDPVISHGRHLENLLEIPPLRQRTRVAYDVQVDVEPTIAHLSQDFNDTVLSFFGRESPHCYERQWVWVFPPGFLSPTDGGVDDISARAVDPGGQVCSPF